MVAQQNLRIQTSETETKTLPFDPKNVSGITNVYPTTITGTPRVDIYSYLDKLGEVVKKYNKGNSFEVLVTAQTDDKGSLIFYFGTDGNHSDQHEYIITGDGRTQAVALLKPLWSKDMSLNDFTRVSYFIIKYIDRFGLNNTVGLGGL
jgi:hypothetical protein